MIKRQQYLSGKVRRWHTHHSMNQTNADHAWGVALILISMVPGGPSKDLLEAAIVHDIGEYITGDMPTTAKAHFPDLKLTLANAENEALQQMGVSMPSLTEEEQLWLKLADSLEAWLFVRNCATLSEAEAAEYFPALGEKARECARKLGLDFNRILGGLSR